MKTGINKLEDVVPVDTRPKCQYCGKPLRPHVSSILLPAGAPLPQSGDQVDNTHWTVAAVLTKYPSGSMQRVDVWTGGYLGYETVNGVPLFCKLRCGSAYGAIAYRNGKRIRGL